MKKNVSLNSPYMLFNRDQWASLRKSVPQPLSEKEIDNLKGINENLSIDEVIEIYLPMARLLNFYISSDIRRQSVLDQFLDREHIKVPYIISVAGSVAVGKSTTSRVLQALLTQLPKHRKVDLVTTDGFLHPNHVLKERNIMNKKGFPESYDIVSLIKFVSAIKSGQPRVEAPIYSHLIYDIVPGEKQVIEQPDVLILEGLNVLQSGMDYPDHPHRTFVSDFVDFSIFVDADDDLLNTWYVERFLKFRQGAFSDPDSYFHHYAQLPEKEAVEIANTIWKNINGLNLQQNILPTRERASLILTKSENHKIKEVRLRK